MIFFKKLILYCAYTLFNFQNFGNKQPAKIQLFILRISQKTSYWDVMEQTKLNLATVWCIIRKSYGKLELTITDTLNWPTLQLRSFWQQHLQTHLKLTTVRKYYKTSWIFTLAELRRLLAKPCLGISIFELKPSWLYVHQ